MSLPLPPCCATHNTTPSSQHTHCVLQVSAAAKYKFLDARGWVPEGCTEAGWSGRAYDKDSVTDRCLKKALESLASQVRAIVVQSGLLARLQSAQKERCEDLLAGAGLGGAPRREDALALADALVDARTGVLSASGMHW